MFKFEELRVYQEALNISKEVYALSKDWPVAEQFGLTSQARRASVSIALNIAEGTSRSSIKEFQHFLDMARGSLYECFAIFTIAESQSLLTPERADRLYQQCNHLASMLNALKTAIGKKQNSPETQTLSVNRQP